LGEKRRWFRSTEMGEKGRWDVRAKTPG
jgi:hypothetical protein